jgi:NAD(P)-dependent dehydrogenase (short-subunit alcohol dehydrogenase family)
MEPQDLRGKLAVVTGAARGIGKATADLLAARGATVHRLDLEAGEGVVNAGFAKIGAADILVNNAGIAVRKSSFDITREEWEKVLAVNLDGLFFCSRAAAKSMRERGGALHRGRHAAGGQRLPGALVCGA